MAESDKPEASSPPEAPEAAPPVAGPDARWRRIHSRTGAIALVAFLAGHLAMNASSLRGVSAYERIAGPLQRSILAYVIDAAVLVPLALHAGYGLRLLRRRADDEAAIDRHDGSVRRWRLQRVTAIVLALFLSVHVWELRIQRVFFGLSANAYHTLLTAHLSWTWGGFPWVALFYVLAVVAATFHAANGVLAAWARPEDAAARRRLRIAAVALGAVFVLVGSATVIGFATGTALLPAADADSAPCGPASAPSSAPSR